MNQTRPTKKVSTAFYMVPLSGGFQVRQLTIEDDIVLSDEPVSDPDAWEQSMSTLENELSKKFQ
jgi:hypothetical protein